MLTQFILVLAICSHAEFFFDAGLASPGGADRALTERARSRVDRQKDQRLEALENEAAQLKEMLTCLEVVCIWPSVQLTFAL